MKIINSVSKTEDLLCVGSMQRLVFSLKFFMILAQWSLSAVTLSNVVTYEVFEI